MGLFFPPAKAESGGTLGGFAGGGGVGGALGGADGGVGGRFEIVGELTGGLAAVVWAPDEEEVAVVTGAGRLLTMTSDWQVLMEVPLEQREPHATAAEGLSANQQLPPGTYGPGEVSLSWRGDGKFFVYHRCNYKWYLKHERRTNKTHPNLSPPSLRLLPSFLWHPESPSSALAFSPLGIISAVDFIWTAGALAPGNPTVAVIDGQDLRISSLLLHGGNGGAGGGGNGGGGGGRGGLLPPPYCHKVETFPAAVVAVAGAELAGGGVAGFDWWEENSNAVGVESGTEGCGAVQKGKKGGVEIVGAVLSNGDVGVVVRPEGCEWVDEDEEEEDEEEEEGEGEEEEYDGEGDFPQIKRFIATLDSNNSSTAISSTTTNSTSATGTVVTITRGDIARMHHAAWLSPNRLVGVIAATPKDGGNLEQGASGQALSEPAGSVDSVDFADLVLELELCREKGGGEGSVEGVMQRAVMSVVGMVGLKQKVVGASVALPGALPGRVSEEGTRAGVGGPAGSRKGQKGKAPSSLLSCPLWEGGAVLVAGLGRLRVGGEEVEEEREGEGEGDEEGEGEPAVVLQATRGSLESVYHRALVLRAAGLLLSQRRFRAAAELARRHRLDPNVLVDFGGWKSFAGVGVATTGAQSEMGVSGEQREQSEAASTDLHLGMVSSGAREFVRQVGERGLRHVSEVIYGLREEDVAVRGGLYAIASHPSLSSSSSSPSSPSSLPDSSSVSLAASSTPTLASVRTSILNQWAEHLFSRASEASLPEAALLFTAANNLPRALQAYRQAGQWRKALTTAARLGLPEPEVRKLAQELREELVEVGRRAEAGRLAIEYEGDLGCGIRLLVEAHCWEQAAEEAGRCGQVALLDSLIVPAAVDAARGMLTDMDETQGKITAYVRRFGAVRCKRVQMEEKLRAEREQREEVERQRRREEYGEEYGGGGMGMDEASETASMASSDVGSMASGVTGLSAYTAGSSSRVSTASGWTATSKKTSGRAARRKQQKADKGRRIRAGSPDEEQALVEHIRMLGPSSQTLEEVRHLLELLTGSGHEPLARRLQARVGALIDTHTAAVAEVEAAVKEDRMKAAAGVEGVVHSNAASDATSGVGLASATKQDVKWKWEVLEGI
ncbi:unnamed protein product [Closterium sp. Yama58-4]|nr:unnamed protein product [Closterium sp. Yama58-4]